MLYLQIYPFQVQPKFYVSGTYHTWSSSAFDALSASVSSFVSFCCRLLWLELLEYDAPTCRIGSSLDATSIIWKRNLNLTNKVQCNFHSLRDSSIQQTIPNDGHPKYSMTYDKRWHLYASDTSLQRAITLVTEGASYMEIPL